MSTRLFSRDALTGITKYWHYDEGTDTAVIETVQDVESLLEENVALQHSFTSLDRMNDGFQHAARIPMSKYAELLVAGKLNDDAYMRRWLNDPDNRKYRTRHFKV